MAMYAGIGGVQKQIGSLYGGIGGVSKELNNIYAGIGGVSKEIHSSTKYLSNLSAGSLLKLNETVGGVTTAVPFLVTGHNHFSNGYSDLLRNELWSVGIKYKTSATDNLYNSSNISNWLGNTYYNYLDSGIRSVLPSVTVLANNTSSSHKVFILSGSEYGFTPMSQWGDNGTAIAYFNTTDRRKAYYNSTVYSLWLRSPWIELGSTSVQTMENGGISFAASVTASFPVARPAFCLPSTMEVSSSVDGDGCYTLV